MYQNKNKNTNKTLLKTGSLLMVIVLVISVLAHLIVANHAAAQRYEIAKFQEDRQLLEKENGLLTLRVTELQSLRNLDEASKRLNLVKADSIRYISAQGPIALGR